ncbi:MAG: GIY-YIG nuclease family protein [Acidobacteria bacterium]|nr:GIY-YIG nuclease family protein [Acidobacteriota bacterium]
MASVYILQSHSSGRYYVGSTNDLSRRLSEQDRAHSQATRGRGRCPRESPRRG